MVKDTICSQLHNAEVLINAQGNDKTVHLWQHFLKMCDIQKFIDIQLRSS